MRSILWVATFVAVVVAVGVGLSQVGATKTARKGRDQWPPFL
jgi:peptidoglycan hydrolase-like amidase